MQKIVRGQCPTQNKDYSISVSYIDASDMDEICYEKGTFKCNYNAFGDKCSVAHCPIYASAPCELH